MYKKGDRVVIIKLCKIPRRLKLKTPYVVSGFNKYDSSILHIQGTTDSVFLEHDTVIPESLYNSPLYKIMNEMEE